MVVNLKQALSDLHQQRKVRAIVLTGSGSIFCSGSDLVEIQVSSLKKDALAQWHHDCSQLRDLMETMLRYPKPIIAAINGPAMGTGAGLLLTADIVVACPEAKWGTPETKRGLVAGMVAPLLLFRIGAGQTAKLLISARNLSADDALKVGIYHDMVATDKVWAKAVQWAEECAQGGAEALQLTRSLINETIGEQLIPWLSAVRRPPQRPERLMRRPKEWPLFSKNDLRSGDNSTFKCCKHSFFLPIRAVLHTVSLAQ